MGITHSARKRWHSTTAPGMCSGCSPRSRTVRRAPGFWFSDWRPALLYWVAALTIVHDAVLEFEHLLDRHIAIHRVVIAGDGCSCRTADAAWRNCRGENSRRTPARRDRAADVP